MGDNADIDQIQDEAVLEKKLKEEKDDAKKKLLEKRLQVVKQNKSSSAASEGATSSSAVKPGAKMDSKDGKTNGGGKSVGLQRSPSAVKEMLLEWCKKQTGGYPHVNVTNFSSSWSDGMAFCALVHSLNAKAFDFSKLDPKRRRGNFKLAFDVAEKLLDIAPLLEVEDMVRMKNPDWKCVFTYVQSFYRRYRELKAEEEAAEAAVAGAAAAQ